MPKSKKRGGEKAHRKRIQNNTQQKKAQIEKARKMFNDAMMEQIESMRLKMSGDTQKEETNNETAGLI